ncbi:unnamed protein product, partial [Cyprideis torosa]
MKVFEFCSPIFFLLLAHTVPIRLAAPRPHIVFILADDLGFNDVGYRGGDQVPTPNIDALAYSGVILGNYYAHPLCTPSRAALLTGRYPIRNGMPGTAETELVQNSIFNVSGMQHYVIRTNVAAGLPLSERTMPDYLRSLGYRTHAVGKWHLGFYRKEFTPEFRGFDSHFGYWSGVVSYWEHTTTPSGFMQASPATMTNGHSFWQTNFTGRDMHRGLENDRESRGTYATTLFTEKAKQIIANHASNNESKEKPLFLYLSHLAPHGANIVLLDQAVGEIVKALDDAGMLQNSIVVFSSDNGGHSGPIAGPEAGDSSNYPLRSVRMSLRGTITKGSVFEGGCRVPGFIFSPLISTPRRISTQLMHITDWLPTLYRAAGGDPEDISADVVLDGVDQWDSLSQSLGLANDYSRREVLLYNLDADVGSSAIRIGKWKYVNGSNTFMGTELDGWFGDSGQLNLATAEEVEAYRHVVAWSASRNHVESVLMKRGWLAREDQMKMLRSAATLQCKKEGESGLCDSTVAPCLFDLEADPCEHDNLLDTSAHGCNDMYAGFTGVLEWDVGLVDIGVAVIGAMLATSTSAPSLPVVIRMVFLRDVGRR